VEEKLIRLNKQKEAWSTRVLLHVFFLVSIQGNSPRREDWKGGRKHEAVTENFAQGDRKSYKTVANGREESNFGAVIDHSGGLCGNREKGPEVCNY